MTNLTPLQVSELVIVESLEDSEVKTGAELAAYVSSLECAQDRGLKVRLIECSYASEFVDLIEALAEEASMRQSHPILHVECHGSADGGLQFANGSELTWDRFGDGLRRLNAATGINLITSVSACHGAHLLSAMPPTLPAPCLMMAGPIRAMNPAELMAGFRLFYRNLFDSGDASYAAATLLRSTHPEIAWDAVHAEQWFDQVVAIYIENECTPKAVKRRALALFQQGQREGLRLSMAELKRLLVQTHRQDLDGKFFDRFFMLDEYPHNAERFRNARNQLKARIAELQSKNRHAL